MPVGRLTATRLARWYYVVRYYRKGQLLARGVRVLRRKLGRTGRLAAGRSGQVAPLRSTGALAGWAHHRLAERDLAEAAKVAQRVLAGRFRLLNEERWLADPVDWSVPVRSDQAPPARLWRFALYYQEYLLDLAAWALRAGQLAEHVGGAEGSTSPTAARTRAWDLVRQWIDGCPPESRSTEDAWHPYVISRRLPVWLVLWHVMPPAAEWAQQVAESLYRQARWLWANLEWDLQGNHLLENLQAVLLAAAFFAGPEADNWLREGARLFGQQLAEQVLPHGEHFERSPMYHARMLEAVLDVRDVLAALHAELSGQCAPAAARMADFLEAIAHPDGQFPLLGDSALGEAPVPQVLIARARGECKVASPEPSRDRQEPSRDRQGAATRCGPCAGRWPASYVGPYWVFRHDGDFLIFDAGPVGADHLPAHAHADLLSIEATWHGRRLLVDSGVFDYEDSPMRRYCRSTAAHNTLEIDGQNQCDMWSRFRMGYRGWPGPLQTGQAGDFAWARCWHNAYRRLGVAQVVRMVACRPGGPWLCLDSAEGRGTHRLASRLHLHPDFRATPTADDTVELRCDDLRLELTFVGQGSLAVDAGWYCPQFGLRLPAPVVVWQAKADLPATVGWCLRPADSDPTPASQWLARLFSSPDAPPQPANLPKPP